MAVTVFDRFVDWFAYHLKNTKLNWSWDSRLQCNPEHPRPKFIREVLLKVLKSV